ncbi:indolepyruvate oxidoreductase subunit beta [Pseudobacteroides cellulosolvens]|uniref:Indolepyruvate ferredoxin oxidoreductase n=1 Tax=Pseudobacteroides cellulosolvens ATCC 35603 = DSM 2933 TaxID=398512 RepID=A0A0L6JIM9_9FIRM|nr:indolepyruvate oxidoreductase subunit beta [Pseudobacteroides cellulosolvens]KNY25595.1 Indolepyruvate ferredoxin oxidoreductase [Pseudobacteroides cellulosolvens ATCC 35603 = DSM 2933]
MKFDILIAGVGGQGTVLASRLLAASAIEAGYFVRTSETIGMAQRGGCVVSHVRIGDEILSPVIPYGAADLLIGFEPAEAARNIARLSPEGKCVVNTRIIKPVTASLNTLSYEVEPILEYINKNSSNKIMVDGYALAEKSGSVKALNTVLLGVTAAAGFLPFSKEDILNAISENVSSKYIELNKKAFNIGVEFV